MDLNHEFVDDLSDEPNHDEGKPETLKDKLSRKLENTIREYEHLLSKDQFKNDVERK